MAKIQKAVKKATVKNSAKSEKAKKSVVEKSKSSKSGAAKISAAKAATTKSTKAKTEKSSVKKNVSATTPKKSATKSATKSKMKTAEKSSVKNATKSAVKVAAKSTAKNVTKSTTKTVAKKNSAAKSMAKGAAKNLTKSPAKGAKSAANATKKKPSKFRVNQKIVYPSQGVGKIIEISEQTFKGEKLLYYKIYIEASDMIVMVPVDRAQEHSIRAIVSADEAEKALKLLSEEFEPITSDWKLRYQMNLDLLKKGGINDIATIVRCLYNRSKVKELPILERRLYDSAKKLLEDEIVFAMGKSSKDVQSLIHAKLEPPGSTPKVKRVVNMDDDEDDKLMDDMNDDASDDDDSSDDSFGDGF